MPTANFHDYTALSFDIFGTLIDWETSLLENLSPLTSQLASSHEAKSNSKLLISKFNEHEKTLMKEYPGTAYDIILSKTYKALASSLNISAIDSDAEALGKSISTWSAFPDTISAMHRLKKRYKIIALSNITNSAISAVLETGTLKEVKFDAVHTAEDIGSYKPDPRNFEYLIEHAKKDLDVEKAQILHVAHGVWSDQVPAEEMGLSHVWIKRGGDNWGNIEKTPDLRWWDSLGELADAVDEEFGRI